MNMQTLIKRNIALLVVLTTGAIMSACGNTLDTINQRAVTEGKLEISESMTEEGRDSEYATEMISNDYVVDGTDTYRDFVIDSVLHSEAEGEIHYCVYVPESYDGSKPYALFVTLPGYEGLYFQGVAVNIKAEEFAFEAQAYNEQMIIVAPQLNDWGETSAKQTIALTEYFLSHYNIDPEHVYINGYSGGGETLSLVLDKSPELYTAALMCSSKWDGDYETLVNAKTPVYFVIGESDEYYGSEPFRDAFQEVYDRYLEQGLSEQEIDSLVVLDVKDADYFTSRGMNNQHGGGAALFCKDTNIMGWLFRE